MEGSASFHDAVLGPWSYPTFGLKKTVRPFRFGCMYARVKFDLYFAKFFISILWVYYYLFFFCFSNFASWFRKEEKLSRYNNQYLWILFRQNIAKQEYSWLDTKETYDALDHYIDNSLM